MVIENVHRYHLPPGSNYRYGTSLGANLHLSKFRLPDSGIFNDKIPSTFEQVNGLHHNVPSSHPGFRADLAWITRVDEKMTKIAEPPSKTFENRTPDNPL
ncbi:hypothetical protein CDAR_373031 [Caerostris darwini]|uniref:Uncharacterized protein n=1 Tax=Caerostris darwini TaxID=1538125 RepID=A0AAV4SU31_9ARAC|nr:hypothetical protein CDAR_373031 [Caerostris darwini]